MGILNIGLVCIQYAAVLQRTCLVMISDILSNKDRITSQSGKRRKKEMRNIGISVGV